MELLADLHHVIIHFPIVCFLFYTVLEISGVLTNKEIISKAAFVLMFAGILFSVIAVLTGNGAEDFAVRNWNQLYPFPEELMEEHESFATITVWFFALVTVIRTYLVLKKKFIGRIKYIFIIFAIIGAFLIWQTGHLGGQLVYEHGVGTELTIDHENGKSE